MADINNDELENQEKFKRELEEDLTNEDNVKMTKSNNDEKLKEDVNLEGKSIMSEVIPLTPKEKAEQDERLRNFQEELSNDNNITEQLNRNFIKFHLEDVDKELNLGYIDNLEDIIFHQRMMEERQKLISEKMKEEKKILDQENLSYFENKKREKEIERSVHEDFYSVEKELVEKRKKAIEQHEEIQNKIKNTKDNKGLIEERKDLEKQFMLGDTLDDYIMASYNGKEIKEKLREKFPQVQEKLKSDIMNSSDQVKFQNENLRRADGVTKLFNKENPNVEPEINGFMSKIKKFTEKNKKTLSVAGKILTGVGLVTNLPATATALAIGAIMKTKPMKALKEGISRDIGYGLDKIGINENSKLRKGLRIAAAVTGMAAVIGVGMLAAGNVDMEDITKRAGDLTEQVNNSFNDMNKTLDNVTSVENTNPEPTTDNNTPPEIKTIPEFNSYEIKSGDELGDLLENIDSAAFDLQGNKLHAVAQFIAEQNGIVDANNIMPGQTVNLPATTEDLKLLVEQNQERINQIMEERTQMANETKADLNIESSNNAQINDLLSQNSNNITESVFKQTMSDKEWVGLENKLGVDREELEKLVKENIENQIQQGKFPKTIQLDLQSYNGKLEETVILTSQRLDQSASLVLQENGINKVSVDYGSTNIEEPTANSENTNQSKSKLKIR
jgi:hypothetical protein